MGIEIERKFLVANDSWKQVAESGLYCKQGYLCSGSGRTVRVRIIGNEAFLTIKGPVKHLSRIEFEYSVPVEDAEEMLDLCDQLVEKVRYLIPHDGKIWELDVFHGDNEGLILAEIELMSADESFEKPDWVGEDVSHDVRYFNAYLAKKPYLRW